MTKTKFNIRWIEAGIIVVMALPVIATLVMLIVLQFQSKINQQTTKGNLMREIKFRVWNTLLKKYIPDDLVHISSDGSFLFGFFFLYQS